MADHRLRIVEWSSRTPIIAVCTGCKKEFRVPMSASSHAIDAEEYLQKQSDKHGCTAKDSAE